MCDDSVVRALLFAAMAAIAVAIGLIVAAMIANGSIIFSGTAPGWMAAAAAATAIAVGSLVLARIAVEAYYGCLRDRGLVGRECDGKLGNLLRTLEALILVLGIQVAACVAAAGVAWIPLFGIEPMVFIVGTLAAQLPLIAGLFAFLADLRNCLPPPPTPPVGTLASITSSLDFFGLRREARPSPTPTGPRSKG
jgi:hypothetical protein